MKEDERLYNIFLRKKPANLLIHLKNQEDMYALSLSKLVDCTYSHVVKILQTMEKSNLIKIEKKGRLKLLSLTKRGENIATHIESIKHLLKDDY